MTRLNWPAALFAALFALPLFALAVSQVEGPMDATRWALLIVEFALGTLGVWMIWSRN
jgi:cellulose synthase/poly-beta-1,6-N-acetylglucosamine synthase-like glycosyltransferase